MIDEVVPRDNPENLSTPRRVGSKARVFKLRFSRKVIIIVLVALTVVAIVIVMITQQPKTTAPKISTSDLAYKTAIYEGKYAQGQQILDEAIKKTTNVNDKANLYLQKASIAINASKPKDAIQFAGTADGLVQSSASASMIADASALLEDKTTAIEWLNTAIQRLDKKSPLYQSDVKDIQQRITDLNR